MTGDAVARGKAVSQKMAEEARRKPGTPKPAVGNKVVETRRSRPAPAAEDQDRRPTVKSAPPQGRKLVVTRGNQITARRIDWVIQDWMPVASLVLLAGREGLGKSTIACSIAAEITRGTLDGVLYGKPANVLYIHSEDSREHTVGPRLIAAGADMQRVLFVDVANEYTEHGNVILPVDTEAFEELIREHQVALVVLDAATSVMKSELSGHDDRKIRDYLEPLTAIADRQRCVILGLVHFGKRESADTGKLILGSIAWSQVPRSVLSVALDSETGNLLVTNTKKNLAPRQRSMEAAIETTSIKVEGGTAEVGRLRWLGESDRDVTELLSGTADDDAGERTAAEHWLEDYLTANGPTASKVIKADAAKERISDRTLKRAKVKLDVRDHSSGFPRTSTWYLPSQANLVQGAPVHGPTGPTGPTGDDQRKQDGPTEPELQLGHTPVCGPTGDPTGPTPAFMPPKLTVVQPPPPRQRQRTIRQKSADSYPSCTVCGKPVVAGQGSTHLSCEQSEGESA